MAMVGLTIALAYVLRLLIPNQMDPSALASFGDDSGVPTDYARELVGEVVTRPLLGHDGRFFFAQANDPWLLEPTTHAAVLDRPLYRSQRMAYPVLASGFGVLSPPAVLWGLVAVNLVAFGLGTWATASVATQLGASAWLGLGFALNFGVISELDIDGGGVVALAAGVGAVLALLRDSRKGASTLLIVSALAREVMLLFAAGIFVAYWWKRKQKRWSLVFAPMIAVMVWALYVRLRLDGIPGNGMVTRVISLPLVGLGEAFPSWIADPLPGLLSLSILLILLLFGIRWRPGSAALAWGAAPFVLLASVLAADVWREPYDLARAIAPVLTAYPFLLFVRSSQIAA